MNRQEKKRKERKSPKLKPEEKKKKLLPFSYEHVPALPHHRRESTSYYLTLLRSFIVI